MSTELLMDAGEGVQANFERDVPFLVIEFRPFENRPENRVVRIVPRIQSYLSSGVQYVYIVDFRENTAICFSQNDPAGAACDVLRTENPSIEIPLQAAFDLDA
jgi:hypothetical protein